MIFEAFKGRQTEVKVQPSSSNLPINQLENPNHKPVEPEIQAQEDKVSNGKPSTSKEGSNSQPHALHPTPTKQQTITQFFNEPKSDKRSDLDSDVKKQSTSTANTEKSKKTSGKENKRKTGDGLDGFVIKKTKAEITEHKE